MLPLTTDVLYIYICGFITKILFSYTDDPVSYTHLTLPTNREV